MITSGRKLSHFEINIGDFKYKFMEMVHSLSCGLTTFITSVLLQGVGILNLFLYFE